MGTVPQTGRRDSLCALAPLIVLLLASSAYAAERVVLCEEFTNRFCQSCQYAGPPLDQLVEVYGGDSVAFIQYQLYDPPYTTPWVDARWAFFGPPQFTPAAVFDGTDIVLGAVPEFDQQYALYRNNHLLPDRAIPTDVTITLGGTALGGDTYRISAEVSIEAGGTGKTLRIFMVQVLDHWPDFKPYHRNGFKQAAPTQDITLAPGATQVVTADFTLDADSLAQPDDVKIIVWAADAVDSSPAAVHQAAVRDWPLISFPNDVDGDGHLDGADNCPQRYNPDQADGDGDGVGDACDNCAGLGNADQADVDEDTYGDACDNCPVLHDIDQGDTDADLVGNPCDSCPDVPAPAGVDPFGRSRGCIDLDCDVDGDDFALLDACLGGPDNPTADTCATQDSAVDIDGDGDSDLADARAFQLNFTGPLLSPAIYVGSDNCIDCHAGNHTSWMATIHSTAFDTLVASGDGGNVLCFPCHAVGYGKPSGFVDLQTTPHLADIQCESCHGPGSNHVADPNIPLPLYLEADSCGKCHQSCHGLCGDDHHPQYEQWQESQHRYALDNMRFDPDAVDDCLRCHSTDYRLAATGAKPNLLEAQLGIDCVACHDPHGSGNAGQLRLPAHQVCADCHTMENVTPPAVPPQAQAEVLHSTGGYELNGDPLVGPYTQHWWGIGDECVTCHVHFEPYGGPSQPVNSGHTFEANFRACLPCHTEAVAIQLTAEAYAEVNTRMQVIAPYFNPGEPQYLDPNTLDPNAAAQYLLARFNFDLVAADKSYGAHNAPYARALLAETEEFLDIPPWYWMQATEDDPPHQAREHRRCPGQARQEVR